MDILNTAKSAFGGGEKSKQNELIKILIDLISKQSGGLNGLISQFSTKGLGDVASSWVGTGKNLSVSPDQILGVFGADKIKDIGSKLGMESNEVASQLSNLLPQVVDKMTPEGKIPEGDVLSKGKDLLGGLFGK
jgi:uncharacterized protein YidB (DUF937 family)